MDAAFVCALHILLLTYLLIYLMNTLRIQNLKFWPFVCPEKLHYYKKCIINHPETHLIILLYCANYSQLF